MEEKFGLISGIEVKFVKTEPEVIEAIAKKRDIEPHRVKSMMRYNIFTIAQFAELAGLAVTSIINKTRPSIINKETGALGTELDFCYPYQTSTNFGPKFIVRNEKSNRYLKSS